MKSCANHELHPPRSKNEQVLIPNDHPKRTSRGFYFEGKNVPKPGDGLEEFLLAVRGSPDPMGIDGLGGDSLLQSKGVTFINVLET
jgi:hypothetical protein